MSHLGRFMQKWTSCNVMKIRKNWFKTKNVNFIGKFVLVGICSTWGYRVLFSLHDLF